MAAPKSAASIAAVCDAGPLIHLGSIGEAHLLGQFSPLLVPERVRAEAASFTAPEALSFEIVKVSEAERQLASERLTKKLEAGEIECLAICLREPGLVFLTDDLTARREAQRLGFGVHGSVGIIVRACRVGLVSLTEADAALVKLGNCRLFVTNAIIELAREQLRSGIGQ